jgi:hypothetical protein
MITTADRRQAIRQLVDMHGSRLGLDAGIRASVAGLALVEYEAEGHASAHRAVQAGRKMLNRVAADYLVLEEGRNPLEVKHVNG